MKIEHISLPTPVQAPDFSVHGMVIEKETNTAIADALIRFEGRDLTGLISTAQGHFVTGSLEPGRYTFKITAPGYKEGTCSIDIGDATSPADGSPAPGAALSAATGRGAASSPAGAETAPGSSTITCELEPVAKVSNLNGRVTDTSTGDAIGTASVKITDVLGRELELQVDEVGAFRFENVPPGAATITIRADGYLKSVTRLGVEPLQELDLRFVLAPVPAKPTIGSPASDSSCPHPLALPRAPPSSRERPCSQYRSSRLSSSNARNWAGSRSKVTPRMRTPRPAL